VFSNFLSNTAMEEKPLQAMKNLKILAILFLFAFCANSVFSQAVPKGKTWFKVQECPKLNKTIRDPANTALQDWVKSIEGNGFIKFNMEKMQNNPDLQLVRPLLGMSAPNSFVVTRESASPSNGDITFVTAQQYFNGVFVEGGGYIQGYIGCVTFFLNAYIFEDINIGLTPTKTKQQAIAALQSNEGTISTIPDSKVQLVIDQNLKVSCDYVLAWKLSYAKGSEPKIAFVNAINGAVYKITSKKREISAPTTDYGTATLLDFLNTAGTTRTLKTPDQSVITYDKSSTNQAGLESGGNQFEIGLEESIPASLSAWPTGGSNPEPQVYQAHYVATNARQQLESFGLVFPSTFHVAGHADVKNAGFRTNVNTAGIIQSFVFFGRDGNKSLALLDIAGHELTHMHLAGVGLFSNGGEPGGIEEAVCDIMGEYVERNSPGGLNDWIAGGQNGLNARSLANPVFPNYYAEIGDEDDVHEIGGPMTRWFTILTVGGTFNLGGQSYVVPSMDRNDASFIVVTALNYMSASSDYFDARAATIAAAEELYGDCSDEVEAVATAWYAVNVGYPDYCKLVILGPREYCEEDLLDPSGDVDLVLANPVPNYSYKWTFPYNWHAVGEAGPQTYYGHHLLIYQYGSMPNFPRYYSITVKEYNQSNNFLKYKNITITINDCDNDDPTNPCGGNPPAFLIGDIGGQNEVEAQAASKNSIEALASGNAIFLSENHGAEQEYEYSVYDISGRSIQSGKMAGNLQQLELPSSGMYIFHVYDKQHKTVQVGKICFVKN
jgi:Zn-dependent metalloprotease